MLSLATTLGVLVLGVLPGVLLAVALALIWLLYVGSKPHDATLGRMAGVKGFHNIADYPEATTIPGLLLYRFDSDLVFFNADYFKQRVLGAVAAARTDVEWVVVDASPINVIDVTAVQKIDELREELATRGIVLAHARAKRNLATFFRAEWMTKRMEAERVRDFPTLKAAVRAFHQRKQKAATPEFRTQSPRE
jgi:MFS superfamily sulfate permease-like transporter